MDPEKGLEEEIKVQILSVGSVCNCLISLFTLVSLGFIVFQVTSQSQINLFTALIHTIFTFSVQRLSKTGSPVDRTARLHGRVLNLCGAVHIGLIPLHLGLHLPQSGVRLPIWHPARAGGSSRGSRNRHYVRPLCYSNVFCRICYSKTLSQCHS
jgi:hypothetical protein